MITVDLKHVFVLGFHAPKGTGKDTTFLGLKAIHNTHSFRDAFADPIYVAAAALTGLPESFLRDQGNKNRVLGPADTPVKTLHGKTIRWLLEFIGTELVRDKLGSTHWVELMADRLQKTDANKGGPVLGIITDVRFPNETALCDLVIELRREGKEYGGPDDHISTRRLDDYLIDATWQLEPRMLEPGGFSPMYQWVCGMIANEISTHDRKRRRVEYVRHREHHS